MNHRIICLESVENQSRRSTGKKKIGALFTEDTDNKDLYQKSNIFIR